MENVWRMGDLSRRYYLTHPWAWFRDLFQRIKWAWQRSLRGYADCDWWNMDRWMIAVLAPMFDDYAENSHGYPGEFRGFTQEKWTNYIKEIAQHIRNADEDQTTQINEYEEAYDAICDTMSEGAKRWVDDSGFIHYEFPSLADEEEEVRIKYNERYLEIMHWREAEAKKAFEMIGKEFFNLWD